MKYLSTYYLLKIQDYSDEKCPPPFETEASMIERLAKEDQALRDSWS